MKISEKELRKIIQEETKGVMEDEGVVDEAFEKTRAAIASLRSPFRSPFDKKKKAAKLIQMYGAKVAAAAKKFLTVLKDAGSDLSSNAEKMKVADLPEMKRAIALITGPVKMIEKVVRMGLYIERRLSKELLAGASEEDSTKAKQPAPPAEDDEDEKFMARQRDQGSDE